MLAVWQALNPFPHIDAFWRLCSRQLFENMATKEEIDQNEQFPFVTTFSTLFNYCTLIKREFLNLFKVVCCRFVVVKKVKCNNFLFSFILICPKDLTYINQISDEGRFHESSNLWLNCMYKLYCLDLASKDVLWGLWRFFWGIATFLIFYFVKWLEFENN